MALVACYHGFVPGFVVGRVAARKPLQQHTQDRVSTFLPQSFEELEMSDSDGLVMLCVSPASAVTDGNSSR